MKIIFKFQIVLNQLRKGFKVEQKSSKFQHMWGGWVVQKGSIFSTFSKCVKRSNSNSRNKKCQEIFFSLFPLTNHAMAVSLQSKNWQKPFFFKVAQNHAKSLQKICCD